MMKLISFGVAIISLSTLSWADDTEIFTGTGSVKDSNVLFIMDSSGSMNFEETISRPPYDSTFKYDDSKYGFDPDLYYIYKPINSLDGAASSIIKNDLSASQITCSAALSAASSTGVYSGDTLIRGNTTGNDWWGPYYGWFSGDNNQHNDKVIDSTDTSLQVGCGRIDKFGYSRYFPRLFSGNYLNYLAVEGEEESTTMTRMEILRKAAKDAIGSLPDKVNIGLMRFNSDGEGGRVISAMKPARENQASTYQALDQISPNGGTPLSETMYEAGRYMTSSNAKYSARTGTGNNKSVAEAFASGSSTQFELPDTSGYCGVVNKIVLFTDGSPSEDNSANVEIESELNGLDLNHKSVAINNPCSSDDSGLQAYYTNGGDAGIHGHCMEEIAYALYKKHGIVTDTIGGFAGTQASETQQKLQNTASAGGGSFTAAVDYDTVRDAIVQSAVETLEKPSTFTAPAIAVSSYNSLQISDELYYAVFEPNNTAAWKGNLKRYRISNKGVVDSDGIVAIGSDGYFTDSAVSFWSETEDGADVSKGGIAERFGDKERNIKILNAAGNLIQATPASVQNLTGDLLGLSAAGLIGTTFGVTETVDYELALANWISGLTPNGQENRLEMGDAIHSRPVVVNYSNDRRVVYIGTNSGYLHAFDTDTGQEIFSILPQEVLTNARFYMDPESTSANNKLYGLDGPITYWHDDQNLNGVVDNSEKVYLYVGMRRGGHSYYAFDISSPDNPILTWKKHGEYLNNDKNTPTISSGYEKLGQTWSSLKPALVKWQGSDQVVLFAGGGYDPAEDDNNSARIDHSTGNTVYMINAKTGEVLWDAYNDIPGVTSNMRNSFAGDVTPVDRDGNGYVDLLFAADTGGRIWRFDWKEDNTGFNGGVIADMNTSSTSGVSGNRRFYVSPDVSYIKTTRNIEAEDGSKLTVHDKFLLVSIGTGYRAHPLNEEVNDHFYLVKDPHGLDYPSTYKMLSVSDLANWNSNDATDAEKSVYGWYFDPSITGEKVMSPSITLNGVVTFNTFATTPEDSASCSGNLGFSRTYQLALSEEIRSRIKCSDGSDNCKPDTPGETPTIGDPAPRLKPDPTLVMPDPDECPEGETCDPIDCEDYAINILSGTTLTKGNMDRCDLFETNYWEESL